MGHATKLVSCISLILVIAATVPASAQVRRSSGQRRWVVVKSSLQDFSGKADEEIADFDQKQDAQAEANRLNEATPASDTGKYVFLTHKRLDGETSDPPAPPSSNAPNPGGSKKPGTLGTPGSAPQTKKKPIVVRVYQLHDGRWSEVRSFLYTTDTDYEEASRYFQRFKSRDRFTTATWNAPGWPGPQIQKPEMETVDVGKPQAVNSIAGTNWHGKIQFNPNYSLGLSLYFEKSGQGREILGDKPRSSVECKIRWLQNGSNVTVTELLDDGREGATYTFTLEGGELSGVYSNGNSRTVLKKGA